MLNAMRRFFHEEDGAAAIEYALIASAIAVVIATAAFTLGGNIRNMFTRLAGLIR
ncbi:MAG: Flp family type IVb pilin [Nitrospira sp.]|jgi:Flp pilus assembly pilin Flp|nr:Flp family type IVb pilin [Nitrospira sp.]MBX3121005.1 Flp family type IVb pilin [Fimbriimonadaceae bacterium]MBX3649419.1 Flp family type IVb pilin [Rhodocyclaceae bacterium]MBX3124808.1 Flp family type IVb pilin [Nitrospira sp.]MCS6265713.1 Flp family type IVb pilin [Nitrospira sp.]